MSCHIRRCGTAQAKTSETLALAATKEAGPGLFGVSKQVAVVAEHEFCVLFGVGPVAGLGPVEAEFAAGGRSSGEVVNLGAALTDLQVT